MIEKLRTLLFEPRYPQRYVGRHRMPVGVPVITLHVRRPHRLSA